MESRVRWGILSTARIAQEAVIPAIRKSRNGVVVAIASRDSERARAMASEIGVSRALGRYEDLLSDPEVDAIYNPLPAGLLAEWSLRCAEAGKPTLVEKPFATSASAGRQVLAAFADAGVPVAEAFMYRHHPLTQRALEIVRSGRLGELRSMRASFHTGQSDEADIRFSPELGGGAMSDLGCYCLSVLHAMAGRGPVGVVSHVHRGPTGVDEQAAGVIDFGGGLAGSFSCGFRSQFECGYEAIGAAARLRVGRCGMVTWPGESFAIEIVSGDDVETIEIEPADPYQAMVENFGDVLRGDADPLLGADGIRVNLRMIDRVLRRDG